MTTFFGFVIVSVIFYLLEGLQEERESKIPEGRGPHEEEV